MASITHFQIKQLQEARPLLPKTKIEIREYFSGSVSYDFSNGVVIATLQTGLLWCAIALLLTGILSAALTDLQVLPSITIPLGVIAVMVMLYVLLDQSERSERSLCPRNGWRFWSHNLGSMDERADCKEFLKKCGRTRKWNGYRILMIVLSFTLVQSIMPQWRMEYGVFVQAWNLYQTDRDQFKDLVQKSRNKQEFQRMYAVR